MLTLRARAEIGPAMRKITGQTALISAYAESRCSGHQWTLGGVPIHWRRPDSVTGFRARSMYTKPFSDNETSQADRRKKPALDREIHSKRMVGTAQPAP